MTDYARLIREDNPYQAIVQGDQAQALRGAMAGAAATQPDVEAKLRQLSKQVGVPLDSVRLDPPQAERQAAIGAIDYNRLVRENPITAGFLTEQAAVARDDVGTLTRIERAFSAFGQGIQKGSLQEDLGPLHYKAMTGEITPAEQARRKQLSDQMKALDALPEKGDSPLSWFLNVTGYTGRQLVTSVKEAAPGALAGATAGAAVGGLAAPVAPVTATGGAVLGARAGYITMSTVYNYKTEAGFAFDEFEQLKTVDGKPMPRDVAQGAAAAVGLLNAGLETVGELALLKLVPGLDKLMAGGAKQAVKTLLQRPTFRAAIADAGKRWMKAASIEGLTEGLQEITVILGRELAQGVAPGQFPATPIGQDVDRVLQATAEGAAGAAGVGAPATGVRAGMNIREVRIAQRNQDFMVALGESAQASKLRERLPEAFRDFVSKAREAGPVENVYIPADQFAKYFQSQNVDPAAVAAEVGATNFAEAAAAGTDVVIPLENYAEKLAATQHHSGLLQDVKLHQGDLTMREAKAMEQRQQELQAELEAMIDAESGKVAAPVVEQIKQEAMGELVGRYERGTADAYATTYAKAIASLAQRAGIDPMELHRQYGLRVVTPLPDILQQQPNIDTALDPLLDRLRAGDLPTEAQAFGPSLFEFIRSRGGLQPVGETRAMDENVDRRAFQRKITQPGGMSLDTAMEAAVEAGYFMQRGDEMLGETDLLDALAEDVAGNRVFSPQMRNEQAAALREQLTALAQFIEQIGGDVANMDNAALKALILKAGQTPAEDGQQFDQAFNGPEQPTTTLPEGTTEIEVDGVMRPALNSEGRTIHPTVEGVRNFWRWFGDSKVVDAQGRPLVMYHGTSRPGFAVFDRNKTLEWRGPSMDTVGSWFSDNPSDSAGAGLYAAGGNSALYPVYLSVKNPKVYRTFNNFLRHMHRAAGRPMPENAPGRGSTEELREELKADEYDGIAFEQTDNKGLMQDIREMQDAVERAKQEEFSVRRADRLPYTQKRERLEQTLKSMRKELDEFGSSTEFDGQRVFIAFEPEQIKSAIGNYGTFDPNQQSILYQSATIRSGRETLKKYGLIPGEKYKTRQVAAALEARQRAKYGLIEADDRSPEALGKIAKWMAEEVMFEMQHPEKSGVGWYSEKFQRALDVFGDVYPELKTDQNARNLLTALIAITSDGQKVVPNFAQAIDVYGNFRESGKFTTDRGHIRQDSILNNLAKIQELHDTLGPEGMREYLMQEATVSELKRAADARGIKFSTQYQANIKLPMAALIFGPKLGAFYANLMGAHGYLTMDRWWSRTFNRYRGTLLSAPTKDGLVRFRGLLAADKGIDTAKMSEDELLSATIEYRESYEAKSFKNGTEIEKAANTIYKDAFEGLEDAPFNAKDRTFMLDAVQKARQSLKRRGVDMSIADIQAVLWYYEKRLYGELGARQTADISYEEAARKVAAAVADGGGDRSARLAALSDGEGAAVRDAENVSPGEEDFVEEGGAGQVTLFQAQRARDDYTLDLFGVPEPAGDAAAAEGSAAGRQEGALFRDDAPGRFATRTQIVEETTRTIGTDRVTNAEEAAQALAYLGRNAVERFDALITDQNGKPLAIVGSFKGALSQASVYPATLAAEAFRIQGAANIWFAHNHPSGNPSLSRADENMMRTLREVFRGSEITAHGLFAIAGTEVNERAWSYSDGVETRAGVARPGNTVKVPAVERVIAEGGKLGRPIDSPVTAKAAAVALSNGQSGALLMDTQHVPVAFVPIEPEAAATLRTGGRMDALWRALSVSNAGTVILVNHGGAYDTKTVRNLGGFFQSSDARVLDVMDVSASGVQSYAERGLEFSKTTFAQADDGDKRGFIQFGADRKFTIGLLEKADLSTFLHETGHFWLEVLGDLAERQDAAEQIKADYQTLLDWFGVKSRAEITVEHHEKFARANEAYLMEGKAPSAELRGIFQRFRAWLSLIYRSMKSLNVQLNDDVRGVLDRVYATDEEIEAAKRQLDAVPLFTTAAEAGMTEGEFAAYRKTVEAASEAAKEKLQGELMREYQRAREKWWKEQRAAMRLDVEAEVDATPVYQAFAALVDGKLPDGTPIKLSKDDLVRRYGEEYLKRLPRGFQRIYTAEGGTSVDVAAETLGFESGTALIEALVNMRPRKDLIEAETDARMAREYGDMMLDGTIAEEAMQAIHNEERAKIIAAELRALRRQQSQVQPVLAALSREEQQARRTALDLPSVSVFRAAAAGRIGQMQAKDINPHQYLLAERRASKAAYEAAAKKDYVTAATEKQRELMNHYLYLEATKARQEIEKVYAYMGRFEKSATREKLGRAGGDYLDQIDAILERYEFKRVSLTALAKRQSLLDFVQEMESQGLLVNIPDALLDEARRVNYREASVDELRAVRDTVKNIEHLATLKDKLLRKREAIEFAAVKAELIDSARDNFKPTGELGKPNRKGETVRDKGARLWKWFDAKHLKVEQLVEWLDGGKIDGPWARYLFDQAADAQTREYELHAMVTAKLQELAESMPKEWRDSMADKTGITLPGIEGPVTRYTLLSLALNTGNASNLQRLRDGYGWSDATIASALGELTADDARFVQGVWDTVNSLWPEIVALEKRVTGIAPPKVEATPVNIGGVEVAGGYFPLVYDSRLSAVGEKQAEATESLGQFLANAYGRARTDRGYTKQRVETLTAPVLLDFEQVLTSHLTRVIKDVSHREAIYSLNKILKDGDIKAALIDTVGEEQYRELNKWVQVLVADRADTLHQATGAAKLIMQFRTNMAIVTMGWKISTMMAQFAGFGPSADLVKPRYLTQALVDFNRYGPWSSHRETLANMVYEKSGEMKFRSDTIERDVRDSLRRMQGDNSPLAAIRKTAFYLTAMADRQVTIPTWLGAYRQALAEGQTEESAVRAGDRAVRLSQGSGGTKDLAAVQRDNELMRLLTMYYSPFSVLYARLRDLGHTTRRVEDMPRAVARVLALVILPAVLGDLLAAKGPGDDEDGIWWAIRKALLYPIASIPVVRDLSSYLEAKLISIAGNGEMKFAPSFSLSPVVGAMDKVARTVFMKIPEAVQGQRPWDDVAWDTLEASGYVLGLPTAQVRITGEYITDVLTNQAHPESPQQALHDLLFKRPPERK